MRRRKDSRRCGLSPISLTCPQLLLLLLLLLQAPENDGKGGRRRRHREETERDRLHRAHRPHFFSFNLYDGSERFHSNELNFTCPSRVCPASKLMRNAYFHTVVGLDHIHSHQLMAYRVCEAFQKCIPRENIKLTLHSSDLNPQHTRSYKKSTAFLKEIEVPYSTWEGDFNPSHKMTHAFEIFENITDPDRLIYHTDLDEIPDVHSLARALEELERGECNAVLGFWRDRVSIDGELTPVRLSSERTLHDQYPLRCLISENFVGGGMTKKTVLYKGNLRVDGGQHQVWCSKTLNRKYDRMTAATYQKILEKSRTYTPIEEEKARNVYLQNCREHVHLRERTELEEFLLKELPYNTVPPRYCTNAVMIDHFKFTNGLRRYLHKRIETYREMKLNWWRDSARFMHFIKMHKGICVDCDKSGCVHAKTGNVVEAVPNKTFAQAPLAIQTKRERREAKTPQHIKEAYAKKHAREEKLKEGKS